MTILPDLSDLVIEQVSITSEVTITVCSFSNGPLEGHVNQLKLIKRSMYGRAKLHLLRQRVLNSA